MSNLSETEMNKFIFTKVAPTLLILWGFRLLGVILMGWAIFNIPSATNLMGYLAYLVAGGILPPILILLPRFLMRKQVVAYNEIIDNFDGKEQ